MDQLPQPASEMISENRPNHDVDASKQSNSYTIIRVKRKLPETIRTAINSNDTLDHDRFQSYKRLRHIGSFSGSSNRLLLDEQSLASGKLLQRMGFAAKKRIRISDFDSKQFEAYVEKLEVRHDDDDDGDANNQEKKQKRTVHFENDLKVENAIKCEDKNECEKNVLSDIFNIELTPKDFASPIEGNNNNNDDNDNNDTIITCNGEALEPVLRSTVDEYVYDYYVLMDGLIDFGADSSENNSTESKHFFDANDDDAASNNSNDENYRYNDYPDEGEFSDGDDSDSDSESGSNSDEDGQKFNYFNDDDDEDDDDVVAEFGGPDSYDSDDLDEFCSEFVQQMRIRSRECQIKNGVHADADADDDDDDDDGDI